MKKIFLIFVIYFFQNNLFAKTCGFEWSVFKNEKYAKFTFKNDTEYVAEILGFRIFTQDKKVMIDKQFRALNKPLPRYVKPFSTGTYEYGNIDLMWDLASTASLDCRSITQGEYEKIIREAASRKKSTNVYDLLKEKDKKLNIPENSSKSLLKKLLKK